MKPRFFANQDRFRAWLEKNHASKTELVVGYYKVKSGKPSMTWSESVDQALCFGWIDGIRRSIDDESYCIRFTPRRPGSKWSAVNVRKVEALKREGLMTRAGLRLFEERGAKNERGYSHDESSPSLSPDLRAAFRRHREAWPFFGAQPPGYRRTAERWVMSAKREPTRERRLEKLIESCERGERVF